MTSAAYVPGVATTQGLPLYQTSAYSPTGAISFFDDDENSATTRPLEPLTTILDQIYHYDDRVAVFAFLEQYPFLVPLLLEAFFKISRFFPSFAGFLEVHTDPEDRSDVQLVLSIMTSLPLEDAQACIDRFDEHWWLDSSGHAQGKLCIMLGFR